VKTAAQAAARHVPPVLTAALFALWLLLNQTLSLGHVLLGLSLSIALAWAGGALRPVQPRLRRVDCAIVLLGFVLADIVRSNFRVAGIVLGLARNREARSGFVKIPLELTDPHALAVLACIVTATPGTVWVEHDTATGTLTLHVLDLQDETEWIDWVKRRYERLLMEIFE
jgi:multicomponent K+:H+ antiporter subunit E